MSISLVNSNQPRIQMLKHTGYYPAVVILAMVTLTMRFCQKKRGGEGIVRLTTIYEKAVR